MYFRRRGYGGKKQDFKIMQPKIRFFFFFSLCPTKNHPVNQQGIM